VSGLRVALIHPDAETRDNVGGALESGGYEVITFAELNDATDDLDDCVAAVCDIACDPPAEEALGDHLRTRLAEGGSALGLVPPESAEAIARCAGEKMDDFSEVDDSATVLLARLEASLRARQLYLAADLRRRDADAVLELSQTLSSSLEVSTILHEATRLVARAMQVDRCAIVLLDAERDHGVVVAASENKNLRDLTIDIGSYPELQRLLETSAPVIIADASESPVVSEVRDLLAEKSVGSELLFPIVYEERVVGSLFLRSAAPIAKVDERQTHFGLTVASSLAIAIRNARLFDSFRDHTKRVNQMRLQAERRMRNLEHYEDFFEYAADGMVVLDVAACVLYLNREGHRILGRDREEIQGRPFSEMLTEESRLVVHHMMEALRQGQHCRNVDLSLARPSGEERSLSVSASPLGEAQGFALLSFRDVTELREMQTELKTTKDFLENLIDSSVDGIVAADLRGKVLLFNKGAERIYGYSAVEVIGQLPVWQLYARGMAQEIMAELRSPDIGGVGRLVEKRTDIIPKEGESVPVSLTASIIYEEGAEVATVGIFSDLRERLQIEADLDQAQQRLIETERQAALAELAGAAAHELNQPLTSVVGYAEMLQRKIKEGQPQRRQIDIIHREAERMAEIVRKIGRITKFKTKHYGGASRIVDLDRSSAPEERRNEERRNEERRTEGSAEEKTERYKAPVEWKSNLKRP